MALALTKAQKLKQHARQWDVTRTVVDERDVMDYLVDLCRGDVPRSVPKHAYDNAALALGHVAQFLFDQRVTVPLRPRATHRSQILVLASVMSRLRVDEYNDPARRRLAGWFWTATFAGYRPRDPSAESDRLVEWVTRTGELPSVLREVVTPKAREIAAWRFGSWQHRAVTALLAREDPCDLLTGERIAAQQAFLGQVDGHHLFPKGWARRHGLEADDVDLVVNAAAITGYTNRWIGRRAPSEYLGALSELVGAKRVSELLEQHLAPAEPMHRDDWPAFVAIRASKIEPMIERALATE